MQSLKNVSRTYISFCRKLLEVLHQNERAWQERRVWGVQEPPPPPQRETKGIPRMRREALRWPDRGNPIRMGAQWHHGSSEHPLLSLGTRRPAEHPPRRAPPASPVHVLIKPLLLLHDLLLLISRDPPFHPTEMSSSGNSWEALVTIDPEVLSSRPDHIAPGPRTCSTARCLNGVSPELPTDLRPNISRRASFFAFRESRPRNSVEVTFSWEPRGSFLKFI